MISPHIVAKLLELEQTIEAHRKGHTELARQIVLLDRGKHSMDQIRQMLADIRYDAAGAWSVPFRSAMTVAGGRARRREPGSGPLLRWPSGHLAADSTETGPMAEIILGIGSSPAPC